MAVDLILEGDEMLVFLKTWIILCLPIAYLLMKSKTEEEVKQCGRDLSFSYIEILLIGIGFMGLMSLWACAEAFGMFLVGVAIILALII